MSLHERVLSVAKDMEERAMAWGGLDSLNEGLASLVLGSYARELRACVAEEGSSNEPE